MLGQFRKGARPDFGGALGTFVRGPARPQGMYPPRAGRPVGLGVTPAIGGLFRAGRVLGVSQVNAMATNVRRGGR